jgi:Arc/MetJ family transcription regulator
MRALQVVKLLFKISNFSSVAFVLMLVDFSSKEELLTSLIREQSAPLWKTFLFVFTLCALYLTSNDDKIDVDTGGQHMRTTLAIDDELVAKAQFYTKFKQKSRLIHEALKALIERESARRLAHLGGSEPKLEAPRRRRTTRA